MSKRSQVIETMPPMVLNQLRAFGENLGVARKRRRESLKAWSQRIGVSEPTLTRMEKGDPTVSLGAYATALWLIGRSAMIAELAAPEHDKGALEEAVRMAKVRAVRKSTSLDDRLQNDNQRGLKSELPSP